MSVDLVDGIDELASAANTLFADAPFQSGLAWWRCVVAAALAPGTRPLFAVCREAGEVAAILPLQRERRALSGLVTPYTCLYQPLIAAGADDALVHRVGRSLGQRLRAWPTLRLDALDGAWPLLAPLLAGFGAAGWRGYRFDAFGNWHEPVRGLDWRAYLAARPGSLRETIRRKQRRHGATLSMTLATTPEAVAPGLAAYRDIYRRSWKQPEPFPDFDAALLAAAAAAGVLRLGVLWQGEVALAAQYWIVERNIATLLKLAHDQAARAASPGTVLTAWMLERLLDHERLEGIDFGRGDDGYKQAWAGHRRQRIGVMLADPRRPRGMLALAQHRLAGAIRRMRRG